MRRREGDKQRCRQAGRQTDKRKHTDTVIQNIQRHILVVIARGVGRERDIETYKRQTVCERAAATPSPKGADMGEVAVTTTWAGERHTNIRNDSMQGRRIRAT